MHELSPVTRRDKARIALGLAGVVDILSVVAIYGTDKPPLPTPANIIAGIGVYCALQAVPVLQRVGSLGSQ